ncbi:hypothetical protein BGX29_010571 [Mortierella sp. GBA35]|nr:hypothetical protein BGX29_010571 [Mortierella sp. GBA35]
MEPPSSDYMSIQDLSRPRRTPLQTQLEKERDTDLTNNRRGPGRPKIDTETAVFEVSVLAFREIVLNRLWKNDKRFQSENDFCKHQWDIPKPRKTLLIECAEVLMELSPMRVRPCSEQVCRALSQASAQLQPSALQRTSITPELWQRVLNAWRTQYRIQPQERIDVENISADFVNSILLPQATHVQPPQQATHPQHTPQGSHPQHTLQAPYPQHTQHAPQMPHVPHLQAALTSQPTPPRFNQHPNHGPAIPTIAVRPPFTPQYTQPQTSLQESIQQQHSQQLLPAAQAPIQQTPNTTAAGSFTVPVAGSSANGSNYSQPHPGSNSTSSSTSSAADAKDNASFRDRIAHLLTDPRRFHVPSVVLERVLRFFKGQPHLDPAAFEGTHLDCPISIPFPDIMDSEAWLVPVHDSNAPQGAMPNFAPVQSCFLHVPILPSKRRYETENEVILLDDVRLAGQLNAKLWEEFSAGNVTEAITLVPTTATWFVKTELADWPCVVMSGLKFEQANGVDPCGKVPENTLAGALSSHSARSAAPDGQHRWIAGFRRLFRTHGQGSSSSGAKGTGGSGSSFGNTHRDGTHWTPSHDDDDDSIDPRFDDIYSILPPHKKARVERAGRPSDGQAAWHHSKRRKMDEEGFSKVKEPPQDNRLYESDADMSE